MYNFEIDFNELVLNDPKYGLNGNSGDDFKIFLTVWDVWQLFGTLALFILKI
ncbi:hypothetical protein V528_07915 [Streptococcus thermophilus TH1436]|uniref:Uncharacterized protein n=2 Tax=Streptococcus thermophilus TaxID=1308 RepID=A0A7U7H4Y5_STRTR|nr:hypothetical protein STND_1626 [Streptococcus thermophilus ND03]AFJ84033.1 hypothetical protein Y1U_C1584 [Streptococcus thermophilus MN-ZLW-002]AIC24994.1 hypothetical protein T303_09285 [Streptococcus thermophilus ASCC 1275]AOZ59263.1 hypothetical protein BBD27_1179 [Streptococcus thermophilus]ETE40035.1 hypothetical protein U730_08080 [Streptococcus thermophilus TH1435]ETE40408.1 hypothetical protein V528_07915 [Streptococcus thermophilus TH1436]ETW88218.1 hypothetical protein X841_0957